MKIQWVMSLILVATLSLAQEAVSESWHLFKSSTGFSVRYPAGWFQKGTSVDRLMILSSKGGAQATLINRGQAVISVMEEEKKHARSTLSQVVDHYVRDTQVLLDRSIHNDKAGNLGCSTLREIVSREGAVPPEDVQGAVPYIINTEYFCEVNKHIYVTVLRNFEGDKKQRIYQRIALRVAESLRAAE